MCDLSRGKRLDNGAWIEGFYVHLYDNKGNESHRIYISYAETDCNDFYPDWCEVGPASVSRYTGLTDKNGVKIFEGDILKAKDGTVFSVEWDGENARFLGFTTGRERRIIYISREPKVEVVGNTFDNLELLEGGDGE